MKIDKLVDDRLDQKVGVLLTDGKLLAGTVNVLSGQLAVTEIPPVADTIALGVAFGVGWALIVILIDKYCGF